MPTCLTEAELQAYLSEVFPQADGDFAIEKLDDMYARVRLLVGERHLRPGGTVSGPSIFSLADCTVYMAVLAMIGKVPLAVTTGGSIDFMRKPRDNADLIAECHLLKLGRSLAVGDVRVRSDGAQAVVARATFTYSIPPKRG